MGEDRGASPGSGSGGFCDLYLQSVQQKAERSSGAGMPDTVCGIVKNIGRDGEEKKILTLEELEQTEADMFTTVYVGNEQTKNLDGYMVTPRGYRDV